MKTSGLRADGQHTSARQRTAHPKLSGCITTLTIANFCAAVDTLLDQDAHGFFFVWRKICMTWRGSQKNLHIYF